MSYANGGADLARSRGNWNSPSKNRNNRVNTFPFEVRAMMNDKEMVQAILDYELYLHPDDIHERYKTVLKYGFYGLVHQPFITLQQMCRERGIDYERRCDED